MRTEDIIAMNDRYLMNTFGKRNIALVRADGARVWDPEGRAYLDFLSGISVNNLGHCNRRIVEAIQEQAARLMHCTNLYYTEPIVRLARLLCENSFADRVFFSNSGAEANEAALKLARKHAKERWSAERVEFITFRNSFHGRTFATIAATGQEKTQKGFEPMMPGFHYGDFNDLGSVERLWSDRIAAVMVEPVQGEGGFFPAEKPFLEGLRRMCDERGAVLIFDEIQCGLGRIGRNFAYEHYSVIPDIMTLGKSLGGGLPMGATLAREEVAAAFTPGSHGGTMGGNPIVCAAAAAYCTELFENGLADTARRAGERFRGALESLCARCPSAASVRGVGLMLALQLNRPSADVVKALELNGLLTGAVAGNAIRFHPPLNVTDGEIDEAVGILESTLNQSAAAGSAA